LVDRNLPLFFPLFSQIHFSEGGDRFVSTDKDPPFLFKFAGPLDPFTSRFNRGAIIPRVEMMDSLTPGRVSVRPFFPPFFLEKALVSGGSVLDTILASVFVQPFPSN